MNQGNLLPPPHLWYLLRILPENLAQHKDWAGRRASEPLVGKPIAPLALLWRVLECALTSRPFKSLPGASPSAEPLLSPVELLSGVWCNKQCMPHTHKSKTLSGKHIKIIFSPAAWFLLLKSSDFAEIMCLWVFFFRSLSLLF
jgi:hypothetical protein